MVKEHKRTGAKLTIACMEVDQQEASQFGVVDVNESGEIVHFIEKPADPPSIVDKPGRSFASMGIYVFDADILRDCLEEDAITAQSNHDFGKDIIPKLVESKDVFAYKFCSELGRVAKDCYWRDVGTIDSYYQANMDLLKPVTPMNLYQKDWGIRTYEPQYPPARTVSSATGNEGIFIDSIIADGVVNTGGSVQHSIISPAVLINDGATIMDSILFNHVEIGGGCQIKNCIIDKHVKVPANTEIGYNSVEDAKRFHISPNGIVVVPESYQFD